MPLLTGSDDEVTKKCQRERATDCAGVGRSGTQADHHLIDVETECHLSETVCLAVTRILEKFQPYS